MKKAVRSLLLKCLMKQLYLPVSMNGIFTSDGNLYHHILNPATGFPYENNLYGVSIICKNSVDGDGLSTTCFSLGLEKGMELIETLPDTEAVFITNDYKLHASSGLEDRLTVYND